MKVGIVTITELDNFGNRLQNYALQEVLKQLGHTVETIPNYITYKYRKTLKYRLKEFIHAVRIKDNKMKSSLLKQWRFERFDKKYFKFSKFYSTIDYISPELDENYDIFIAGSDQIWNPYFPFNLDFNFLTFAAPNKRIAYSASFGVDNIPQKKVEAFTNYLNGIKYISVREYAGKEIVKKLTNRDIPVLPDPTLLISKNHWKSIAKRPKWLNVNAEYILTYYLGKTTERDELLKNIYSIHPEYEKLKIIDIHYANNIRQFCITPDEFIYLIQHANLFLTDSFHGAVFSILMETPYVSVKRIDDGQSMNSRIDSLYQMLNIVPRDLISTQHIENKEFINTMLSSMRIEALDYLEESINS